MLYLHRVGVSHWYGSELKGAEWGLKHVEVVEFDIKVALVKADE